MTALLTDNLPLLAGATTGVKKLRELILELAVRGKLVPQDPLEEPASELLKRILEEKRRLVAAGTIKPGKRAVGPAGELSYLIPSTWEAAPLGEVVEIIRGITFPASEKSKVPEAGRVACLRTANVQTEVEWDDLLYIRESFVARPDQFVQPNDIIMSMANSRELVGKVALVGDQLKQKTTIGGFLGILRAVLIEPRFVMALLRTPHARSALIDSASQTTNIANVSLAKLRPLPFAVPPLAEQHRIVAKVDELMALCDALETQQANAKSAHARLVQALLASLTQANDAQDFAAHWQRLSTHFDTLFTTESSIDALKQTVLQLAVMGKLVPQDSGDEPASILLERVAEEKCSRPIERRVRGQRSISEKTQNAPRFELPSGWAGARLGDLVNVLNGRAYKKAEFLCEGTPILRVGNLFTSKSWYYSDLVLEEEKYCNNGDLLFAWSASFGPFIWEGGRSIYHYHIWKLDRYAPQFFDKHYLYLFLLEQTQEIKAAGHGVAMIHMTKEKMERLVVPVPPLREQHRIVAKVDELTVLCDELKSRIRQARDLNQQLASTLVEPAVA